MGIRYKNEQIKTGYKKQCELGGWSPATDGVKSTALHIIVAFKHQESLKNP